MNRELDPILHWFKMDIHVRTNRTRLPPKFILKLPRVEPFTVLEISLQTIYTLLAHPTLRIQIGVFWNTQNFLKSLTY